MIISKDAKYLNFLVNDPDIRPYCGGDGKSFLDFTPNFENLLCFEADGGAWMLDEEEQDIYECHYFFMPEYRGKYALNFGRTVINIMFSIFGAKELIGRAPVENRLTSFYNTALGCVKGPVEEVHIPQLDWRYMAQIFTLTKEDWQCHQQ